MFTAVLLLLACPASQLGIELPPEGMEAISAEDLRRDTEIVLRSGVSGWTARMEQMSAVVEHSPDQRPDQQPGSACVRQGEGDAPTLWAALRGVGGPITAGGEIPRLNDAIDAATLISLAKAWDTLGEKPGPRRYCLSITEAGGADLGTRLPSYAPDAAGIKDVDFRLLAVKLRARPL